MEFELVPFPIYGLCNFRPMAQPLSASPSLPVPGKQVIIPAGLCKDSGYGSRALSRETMAKGYGLSLRRLGLLLPPVPGKTSVGGGQTEGHRSREGMNGSRWDLGVAQSQATRWGVPRV